RQQGSARFGVVDAQVAECAIAFRAEWKAALHEARLCVLPAAAEMMDQRLFHKVGAAALRAGLVGVEPGGTAFPAQMGAGEMASLHQIEVSEQLELPACCSRAAEQRIFNDGFGIRSKARFDRRIARVRKAQYRQLCALRLERPEWKLA